MGSSWEKLLVDGNEIGMYTGIPDSAGAGNGPFPAVIVAQLAGGVDEFLQTIVEGGRVSNPHFKAAVPFYGGFIFDRWGKAKCSPFELSHQLNCPMMFHFGAIDPNPSPQDMDVFQKELDRLDKPHKFYSYPEADHPFMDHTFGNYQKEAAELSWDRMLDFFSLHLKGVAFA